ncbi:hypothetical protein [Conexibacter arvalis]|uniref:Uncharacterized protein n=1 Tax=Conexibacter arvalis TaxID=912552 RepID=A0A840IJ44_9ACTN|nr:hypothetical protein [Conexibacter arvalis]MBB4663948.1 hypothetical protein [Conexibacter arvalis]
MNPALTTIQNDVRAAELRARAERDRRLGSRRRARRPTEEIAEARAAARGAIFGSLFLGHGFFGREHGTHV